MHVPRSLTLPPAAWIVQTERQLLKRRVFWSVIEAAEECRRTPKTLRNLIWFHRLPAIRASKIHKGHVFREISLTARTVAILMGLTRLRRDWRTPSTGGPHPPPRRPAQ